jgi:hypothetical protein
MLLTGNKTVARTELCHFCCTNIFMTILVPFSLFLQTNFDNLQKKMHSRKKLEMAYTTKLSIQFIGYFVEVPEKHIGPNTSLTEQAIAY